jgi:hypothetical protein
VHAPQEEEGTNEIRRKRRKTPKTNQLPNNTKNKLIQTTPDKKNTASQPILPLQSGKQHNKSSSELHQNSTLLNPTTEQSST